MTYNVFGIYVKPYLINQSINQSISTSAVGTSVETGSFIDLWWTVLPVERGIDRFVSRPAGANAGYFTPMDLCHQIV